MTALFGQKGNGMEIAEISQLFRPLETACVLFVFSKNWVSATAKHPPPACISCRTCKEALQIVTLYSINLNYYVRTFCLSEQFFGVTHRFNPTPSYDVLWIGRMIVIKLIPMDKIRQSSWAHSKRKKLLYPLSNCCLILTQFPVGIGFVILRVNSYLFLCSLWLVCKTMLMIQQGTTRNETDVCN